MVILKRKCPLKSNHHSTADWDYSSIYWTLISAFYVSPPSSLKVWHAASGTQITSILSRADCAQCVPQGRILNNIRTNNFSYAWPLVIFRNQAALGTANHQNCYYVVFYDAACWTFRQVNNVPTQIGTSSYPGGNLLINTWYLVRVTWWNDGPINLTIRTEIYRNGAWETADPEIHDPNNQFKDSEINRAGIGAYCYSGHVSTRYTAHDDTSIYVPAS